MWLSWALFSMTLDTLSNWATECQNSREFSTPNFRRPVQKKFAIFFSVGKVKWPEKNFAKGSIGAKTFNRNVKKTKTTFFLLTLKTFFWAQNPKKIVGHDFAESRVRSKRFFIGVKYSQKRVSLTAIAIKKTGLPIRLSGNSSNFYPPKKFCKLFFSKPELTN